ncbi:MAG TPA: glycoside hydrolase family 2 TIM barrel-domain containing protein [archaeon]|nr:glycoside hydrolase family 2 TIM barrel-domain containing protein [archaeon]
MLKAFTLAFGLTLVAFGSVIGSPEVPRPEYPRPQMTRDAWLNLNGPWEFEMDYGVSGEERGLPLGEPFAEPLTIPKIKVPFCPESELSGIGDKDFMTCIWYKRSFDLPADWPGKRVLLHFGAVDYETKVWVNGELAGTHRGGYSPFTFEITGLVKEKNNLVVVRAYDDTRSGLQPKGKQCSNYYSTGVHYTRTTGIWQTVWLEAVPQTYLKSFKLYPDIDRGAVTVQAEIEGETDGFALKAKVTAEGRKVGEVMVSARSPAPFDIPLRERRLWEPGNPFLYDLEFVLEKDGKQVDLVKSYFGLRKVSIEGSRVLINNRPVFQRLVLDQGFYPDGIYTAPTDDALRMDIELSMAVGFNGARLHQKVFEPRFLYWADRLGYLVWGEYPNWGLDHKNPQALERMLPEWLEVLHRDFNHPSIITWTPFNETPRDQNPELLRNIYRVTKAVDPTRPAHDTSGYVHVETDIFSVHCYTQDTGKFASFFEPFKTGGKIWQTRPEGDAPYLGQPYIVDEYGGIWWNPGQKDDKAWGYGERPKSEKEFLDRYRALTETLLFNPRMFGFCYTQLYNIEQEVNGIYTYDRQPKFDAKILKAINSQKAAYENE